MVYDKGVRLAPPLSLIASSSFAFLSYSLVKTLNQAKGELYGLAALATIGIVPYTLFFMAATNETLINKTAEYKAESKREARIVTKEESMQGLLSRWNMLNYGRGVFPLIGTSLGLYATLV